MRKDPDLYCATDQEVYDLLMSGKQRITEAVMLDLAKDRGILYSPKESRETLARRLSLLPHGFHDLNALVERREVGSRNEKTTSITLPPLSMDEIRAVVTKYSDDTTDVDRVTGRQHGNAEFEVKVAYSEIDYSKTRLIQRRKRDANIEFEIKDDRTVVRLPATPKAQEVVEDLRRRVEEVRRAEVQATRIELTNLEQGDARTEFFTNLITRMSHFTVSNVTSVRVESSGIDEEPDEDADAEEARGELLSAVKDAALRGQSLLTTDVYQRLREGGFFITSIVWEAQETNTHSLYMFEAAFDEPREGKGFKYSVRGVRRWEGDRHMKTFRPVEDDQKQHLFELIEETAAEVLQELLKKQNASKGDDAAQRDHANGDGEA